MDKPDAKMREAQEEITSAVFDSVDAADTDAKCEEAVVMDWLHLIKFDFDKMEGAYPDSFSKIEPPKDHIGPLLVAKATLILAVETRRLRWDQERHNEFLQS
jgi:hypothetical protein